MSHTWASRICKSFVGNIDLNWSAQVYINFPARREWTRLPTPSCSSSKGRCYFVKRHTVTLHRSLKRACKESRNYRPLCSLRKEHNKAMTWLFNTGNQLLPNGFLSSSRRPAYSLFCFNRSYCTSATTEVTLHVMKIFMFIFMIFMIFFSILTHQIIA